MKTVCCLWTKSLLVLVFALLQVLCVTVSAVQADEHEDDAMIGQKVYDDLRAKLLIVDDSPYVPILRKVGAKIAKAAEPHWFNERFYVVRGNEINAFSAPGGFVFVNEGCRSPSGCRPCPSG
jgi:beta-barrel assembly-enhancing protease